MIREAIAKAVAGHDLSETEAAAVMQELMSGEATPSQAAALLTALRMKGESVDEITGMVRVMREKVLRLEVEGDLLDVVGTGGGAFDPFNISTAAALVCAGCGVRVAKHGNRGFTSASGSADVLEALGAKLELTPQQASACLEKSGFCFMLAPSFHPAMRFVAPTRREIGIRTIFNSLGPLTNPAGARFQLLGVGDPVLFPKLGEAVSRLGTGRTLVVHSEDGMEEVSLAAPTRVLDVRGRQLTSYSIDPADSGLPPSPLEAVRSGSVPENAARLRAVLDGARTPDRDYTLVNAAAALLTAGHVSDLREGVRLASQSIDSGAARRCLEAFVAATRSFDA